MIAPKAQYSPATRRRGFSLRDLAVALMGLLIAMGLLASLAGADRGLSKATVCASNLHQLFGGLVAYVNQYNSYPPHNPYPQCAPLETVGGIRTDGWDPSLGWILTYGLAIEPPGRYANGHFRWYELEVEDLPSAVVCPAGDHEKLFTLNPEIEGETALESFVYRYAAFYQTGGTCRAAVTPRATALSQRRAVGGRNPPVPNPSMDGPCPFDNHQGGFPPYVYVRQRVEDSLPDDPSGGSERQCWIQAVHPAEVQEPGRVYYLADSRDYRPVTPGSPHAWPPAGINDGWLSGWANKIYLGSRHDGYANVMYLDGRVTRDNQTHIPQWNMDYDAATGEARSSQWRCATFATQIELASIRTQVHTMPVLMVKGWEYFFDADGMTAK